MAQVLESQLLGVSWRSLSADDAARLANAFDDDEVQALRTAIAGVLIDEPSDRVEVKSIEVPGGVPFRSILYRDAGADGTTRRMVAFGIRDAAVESMLPLLGLAISVFTGAFGWGSVGSIGGLAKALWGKLMVLKRPADADAIDVLESIVRLRARHAARGEKAAYPSGGDLAAELPALDSAARLRALTRLKLHGVIDAVAWGDQADDVGHAGNTWRVAL